MCMWVCVSMCIFSLPLATHDTMQLCSQWLTFCHDRSIESLNWSSRILVPKGCSLHFKSNLQAYLWPGHKTLAPTKLFSWWCIWPFHGTWVARHSIGPPQNTSPILTALIQTQSWDKHTLPSYYSVNSFISCVANIYHVMVLNTFVSQRWK